MTGACYNCLLIKPNQLDLTKLYLGHIQSQTTNTLLEGTTVVVFLINFESGFNNKLN